MAKILFEKLSLFKDHEKNEVVLFIRIFFSSLFFLIFQSVILVHKPFLHVDFVISFYGVMSLLFLLKSYYFFTKAQQNFWSYVFDFILIYILFNHHQEYSSVFLVYLTIHLFLSGLHLKKQDSWLLFLLASFGLSVINLKTLHWAGAQNLLSLILFNLTYAASVFVSTEFKTEILYLQKSLSKSNQQLQTQLDLSKILMEQVPLGVIALNSQSEVLFKNHAMLDKLKLTDELALDILKNKADGVFKRLSFFNRNLQEKRIYETVKNSYFDQVIGGQVDLHLINDITDEVNLQDQLRQKEKLAAVGQLAAGIAHEIRNPLAGISGSIQLLSQDKTDPDEQKLMKIILKEIDRLNLLITEFLDYSKPEKSPDQVVDLSLILDDVVNNIKLGHSSMTELKINSELVKSSVLGFSDKLKQAFLNIAVNAVQAMKDRPNPMLNIKILNSLDQAIVIIKDNGSGMSEQVRQRVFEPFFTTKSKGTGLGMAITHKIFETHHARVEIESEIDHGTEFKIYFNKIN